ncbi:hypothetical protein [Paenibacillus yonginensis]|uniref:hypothetical protein n=1 Tax=Paenibacillus yonginensis TaxID=1462996 RepID=UPI0014724401|nr:hypothetical protein [Paenibacillus yonginensis]
MLCCTGMDDLSAAALEACRQNGILYGQKSHTARRCCYGFSTVKITARGGAA